jgi:hypothetical protein
MMAAASLGSNPMPEPIKERKAAGFRSRTRRGWNRPPATGVAGAIYLQRREQRDARAWA